jgi:hypothetical protein
VNAFSGDNKRCRSYRPAGGPRSVLFWVDSKHLPAAAGSPPALPVLVLELRALANMMEAGEVHWEQPPNPNDVEAIAKEYETAADAYEKALTSMDDATFDSDARMYYGGKLTR